MLAVITCTLLFAFLLLASRLLRIIDVGIPELLGKLYVHTTIVFV